MSAISYSDFLVAKAQHGNRSGFDPVWMPDFLFDFQKALTEWAIAKGRAAIFADCGLGKTPMQLVWAENVARQTGRPVLILTPLAVSYQTVMEGKKFGIRVERCQDGKIHDHAGIFVTNYERLHYFNSEHFAGAVCDESSILKSFDGKRRSEITEFMRRLPYRLLCTATAAPNDYIELGTSSEALGGLGHMDMLMRFFKNESNSIKPTMSRRFEKAGKMFSDVGPPLPPHLARVADGLIEAWHNKHIAYHLGLTAATVKVYLSEAYRRTGLCEKDDPRVALALWWKEQKREAERCQRES